MKVLEPKQKNTLNEAEIFNSDFYKELFSLRTALLEVDLLNNLDLILESLLNIFPEIDSACILDKKTKKYKIMHSLGFDNLELLSKSFSLAEIYPNKADIDTGSVIYQGNNEQASSKLFKSLDLIKRVKSRIIIPIKFPYSNLIIVAESAHLEFPEIKQNLLKAFCQEIKLILKHKALEIYNLKKSDSATLISEIKELCKQKSGLEKLLIHTTDRLIEIFSKLKINVYLYDQGSFNLVNNLGFGDIPEKVVVKRNSSLKQMREEFDAQIKFTNNRSKLWSVVFESVDQSLAIVNIVLDKNISHKIEQDFVGQTLEQLKITIEHFLFYQNMIELEHRNIFISENMQGVVSLCDLDGRIKYISPSISKTAGFEPIDLINNSIYQHIHSDDIEMFEDAMARAKSKLPARVMHRSIKSNGENIWVESSISLAFDSRKDTEYLLVTTNINEGTKEAEEHFEYIGDHDGLTGLPNRGQLLTALEQATEKKKQKPQKIFALILINLDRFKNINDNMGHKVGDELLRRVAKRLEACVYSNDLVSRIGGDEFAILLDDLPTNAEAKSVIERVNQEFSRSFFIDDNDIYVSLSMGLAFINDLKLKSTEILRNADLALRSARKNDDGYKIFNGRMLKDYKTKANLEADLQVALNENQLFLVYQPMFDLIRRRVAGFEALIRWNHPTQGLISPADFIPIAEESGLIIEIDYWVLKNAAKQLKSWNLRFNKTKNMFVSINLSARNVVLETSASDISACIRKQGIDPENIKLEVTEGVLMNNMRVASSVLSELRSEGFRIQLDDFGTGYSSLSYIQKLPIDSLKIDQSFIRRMDGGKQDEAIVKAILALGAGLNLEVVAEGVETPYQLERLTEMNCDYAQGYLIARPLVTEEVEKRFFIKK